MIEYLLLFLLIKKNVAEALAEEGLTKVSKSKGSDEERSVYYSALLEAQAKAQKAKKGVWTQGEQPKHHITDLTDISPDEDDLRLMDTEKAIRKIKERNLKKS